MFPLENALLPGEPLPLHVFEPRYRQLTADCLARDGDFGVVLISRGREVGGGDERFDVGTVAHIENATPFDDGRWALLAFATTRVRVLSWLPDDPYPLAVVVGLSSEHHGELPLAETEHAVRRLRALYSELGAAAALPAVIELADDPDTASWQLAALLPLSPIDRQRLVETDDIGVRLGRIAAFAFEQADDVTRLLAEGRS